MEAYLDCLRDRYPFKWLLIVHTLCAFVFQIHQYANIAEFLFQTILRNIGWLLIATCNKSKLRTQFLLDLYMGCSKSTESFVVYQRCKWHSQLGTTFLLRIEEQAVEEQII